MKKYAKWMLCGLAVVMMATGCSKKNETTDNTATDTAMETPINKGQVLKLGTYKGVEVTRVDTKVTDEELEARLQSILAANPEYIEITDRAAQEGDIVNIDYVGTKDGKAFDGGTEEGYDLELGSGTFIDGFEDGLIGARTGDELILNLKFPDPYQKNPELAGQLVVFNVTVNRIEEKKEAVLNDSFVQRMSDFTTVDEFRADTMADMEAQKESQADQQIENDAFLAAVEGTEFEVNQEAVEQLYNNQINYYESMIQIYGMTMEDYASMYGMTEEEFKNQMKTSAELAVKQQLLVEAIAEQEGLQVEESDREELAEQYGMDVKSLQDTYGADAVDENAMMYKVVALIKENAVVK